MGLDMYMYREHYVKNWDHQTPEERHEITIKKGGEVRTDIDLEKISTVSENIFYWRKFNALHGWIVNHCGGGVDECQKIFISYDDLIELYNTLNEVDKDHTKAEELLPTTLGFFFGSEEYDEYYFDMVKETIEFLTPYIESIESGNERGDFYYQSSW